MAKNKSGPQFLKYINPIIDALKKLGGSGTAIEVKDKVVEILNIPETEIDKKIKSGSSRILNQIAWARLYLVKSGHLDSSKRGIWSLTEKGYKANLSYDDIYKMFRDIQNTFIKTKPTDTEKPNSKNEKIEDEIEVDEDISYKEKFLDILRNISPSGFERICQRLLRESDFQQVVVTGQSSDGGIDGHGILKVNPLVSFKVIFQCKRYQGAVSASQIRDFRGAMTGRADKGIFLTTGRFTLEAKKEALRDGVPPIELVDGEQLVEMFEKLELGLKPKITYEIDNNFFEEFTD